MTAAKEQSRLMEGGQEQGDAAPTSDPATTCAFRVKTDSYDVLKTDREDGPPDPLAEKEGNDWVIQCHRQTNDDDRFCVFHQLPAGRDRPAVYADCLGEIEERPEELDDETIADLFRRAITDDLQADDIDCDVVDDTLSLDSRSRHRNQFIGAQFGDIRLTYESLEPDDNYPIDMRCCGAQELDWKEATVGNELRLDGSHFFGGVSLQNATVKSSVVMASVVTGGDVALGGATVAGYVSLRQATVAGDVWLDRATVAGYVALDGATVAGDVALGGATVDGYVWLDKATVDGDVWLDRATVDGDVWLDRATVDGYVALDKATVDGGVLLREARVDGDVWLDRATVDGNVWLDRATVDGNVSLDGTKVDGETKFKTVSIEGCITCNNQTKLDRLSLCRSSVQRAVELTGADIARLEITDADSDSAAGDKETLIHELNTDTVLENGGIMGPLRASDTQIGQVTIHADVLGHPGIRALSLENATLGGGNKAPDRTGLSFLDEDTACDSVLERSSHSEKEHRAPVFDLTGASLGPIGLESPTAKPFENYRFFETEFDGFEFSTNREAFRKTAWLLHHTRVNGVRDIAVTDEFIESDDSTDQTAYELTDTLVEAVCAAFAEHEETSDSKSDSDPDSDTQSDPVSWSDLHTSVGEQLSEVGADSSLDRAAWERLLTAPTAFDDEHETHGDWVVRGRQQLARTVLGRSPEPAEKSHTVEKVLAEFPPFHADFNKDDDESGPTHSPDSELLSAALRYRTQTGQTPFAAVRKALSSYDRLAGLYESDQDSTETFDGSRFASSILAVLLDEETNLGEIDRLRQEKARLSKAALTEQCPTFCGKLVQDSDSTSREDDCAYQPIVEHLTTVVLSELETEVDASLAQRCLDIASEATAHDPDIDPENDLAFWLALEHLADVLIDDTGETLQKSLVAEVYESLPINEEYVDAELSETSSQPLAGQKSPVDSDRLTAPGQAPLKATPSSAVPRESRDTTEPTSADTTEPTSAPDGGEPVPTASVVESELNPASSQSVPDLPEQNPETELPDPSGEPTNSEEPSALAYLSVDHPSWVDPRKLDPLELIPVEFVEATKWRLEVETAIARARAVERHTDEEALAKTGIRRPKESLTGTPGQLEATYVKAKRGAIAQGDQVAAGRLFASERLFAREQHWRRFTGESSKNSSGETEDGESRPSWRTRAYQRAAAFKSWFGNLFLSAVSGYGEKPQRVAGWAIATILIFSVLFWLVGASFEPSPPYGSNWGYVLVSLGSFVTLILSAPSVAENAGFWVNFLAGIEGLLGVSFVALLVFTLTRSIHR